MIRTSFSSFLVRGRGHETAPTQHMASGVTMCHGEAPPHQHIRYVKGA